MKEKNLLKAAAVPAGTIAVAAMSGMAVLANDDVQAVPDEGSEVQIETFALDDPTNTEISTEESQASLGTIEADQDKANESLDVVVPQPDCTTEMMPTPPEPNPEKRPDKTPIDNVEEIHGDPVSGLVTDDPATQKVEVTLDVALKDVVFDPGQGTQWCGQYDRIELL